MSPRPVLCRVATDRRPRAATGGTEPYPPIGTNIFAPAGLVGQEQSVPPRCRRHLCAKLRGRGGRAPANCWQSHPWPVRPPTHYPDDVGRRFLRCPRLIRSAQLSGADFPKSQMTDPVRPIPSEE